MQQNSTAPQPDDTVTANPDVVKPADPVAETLARGRRAAEQLESVGIKLGGYRLDPPLGDCSGFCTPHNTQLRGHGTRDCPRP